MFIPTFAWTILLGRILRVRNWWDRVDEHVVLGALPLPSDVPALKSEGVTGVVNTCAEYGGPVRSYQEAAIEQLHLPTIDFTPPKLDDIEQAIEFIKHHSETGGSVYVHCKAGRGRGATIVLCWLIEAIGATPDEAQAVVLSRRPQVARWLARRDVVQAYFKKHSRVES